MSLACIPRVLLSVLLPAGASLAQMPPTKDQIKINIGGPSARYFTTYAVDHQGLFLKHDLNPKAHWITSGASLLAALKNGCIDQVVTTAQQRVRRPSGQHA